MNATDVGVVALLAMVLVVAWSLGRASAHDVPKEPNYEPTYFGRVPEDPEKSEESEQLVADDEPPVRVIVSQAEEVRSLLSRFGPNQSGDKSTQVH